MKPPIFACRLLPLKQTKSHLVVPVIEHQQNQFVFMILTVFEKSDQIIPNTSSSKAVPIANSKSLDRTTNSGSSTSPLNGDVQFWKEGNVIEPRGDP
uniref:Uncharacterized protein n=1 Tax=Romanomermis culicivorax TaxID=13658 RepID=A0A915L5C1_ROMCU